jgi:hypothetical protein
MKHGSAVQKSADGRTNAPDRASTNRSMSIKDRTGLQDSGTNESIVGSFVDQIARSFTIGTDTDGYDHHYYRPADCVVVYDGRELDHVEHLDGRVLIDWVNYVGDRRGWQSKGQFSAAGVRRDAERKTGGNA